MESSFEQARACFLTGLQALESGDAAAAERAFEASLALLPGRASTLVNLGVARMRLGRHADALQPLQEAVQADPMQPDAWCHLGLAQAGMDEHQAALDAFEHALAHDSSFLPARWQQALCLGTLGRHEAALQVLDELLRIQPDDAATWMQRGLALQRLERHAQAQAAYERAVALAPELGRAWSLLGALHKDAGRLGAAAPCFERALQGGDDETLNLYLLASVQAGTLAPATAPASYVQTLFDSYAEGFDAHLQQGLQYCAPQVLAQLLRSNLATLGQVLDLGCGTGLLGQQLAGFAQAVDGVDLAPRMLELARASGNYRHLVQADVTEHLNAAAQRYDVVVATDVFIYIGELDAVFAGVRRVLHSGGCFAFSVERGEPGSGWTLRPSSRYAHALDYLQTLALRHGFDIKLVHEAMLRKDQGQPVDGLYLLLRC